MLLQLGGNWIPVAGPYSNSWRVMDDLGFEDPLENQLLIVKQHQMAGQQYHLRLAMEFVFAYIVRR